jgi:hypothetical protein
MAAESLSPNLSYMLTERLLSVVFVPNARNIEENHLPLAGYLSRGMVCTVRFSNVELQRRTAGQSVAEGFIVIVK